jgi:glycosyltransferase involved in cell wall biosynthesis
LPDPTPRPLLSVLVPTYNHAQGLTRIVASLGALVHGSDIELRVHDDSTDDRAAAAIERIVRSCACGIYRRNMPSQGAVRNWNGLLDAAAGEYALLMHHDEYFEGEQTLKDELSRLHKDPSVDGIVFPCRIVSAHFPKGRLHMPARLARWIVERYPGYILRRNPIGAPSTLLLRRSMYPRYDNRLRWYVDCELYVRAIVAHSPRLIFVTGPGVISDSTGSVSITSALGSSIKQISADELHLLQRQGLPKARGVWLVSASSWARLARALEYIFWGAFRAIQRLAQAATRRH